MSCKEVINIKLFFGKVIKELRFLKKLTQEQLADGLCSVKQLSRIENNSSQPTLYLIKEFSFRLGEDLMEYMYYCDLDNPVRWKILIDSLEEKMNFMEYLDVYETASKAYLELPKPHPILEQALLWYKGASAFYLKDLHFADMQYFENILSLTLKFNELKDVFSHPLKPFEIRTINSIVYLHLVTENFSEAEEVMLKVIEIYESNYFIIKDSSYLKLLYNLGRLNLRQERYEEALKIVNRGIKHCLKTNTLFYLDDLCNIKGRCLYLTGEEEEGRKFLSSFIILSELYRSPEDFESIKNELIIKYKLHIYP